MSRFRACEDWSARDANDTSLRASFTTSLGHLIQDFTQFFKAVIRAKGKSPSRYARDRVVPCVENGAHAVLAAGGTPCGVTRRRLERYRVTEPFVDLCPIDARVGLGPYARPGRGRHIAPLVPRPIAAGVRPRVDVGRAADAERGWHIRRPSLRACIVAIVSGRRRVRARQHGGSAHTCQPHRRCHAPSHTASVEES
jgi:hypothetical protein